MRHNSNNYKTQKQQKALERELPTHKTQQQSEPPANKTKSQKQMGLTWQTCGLHSWANETRNVQEPLPCALGRRNC